MRCSRALRVNQGSTPQDGRDRRFRVPGLFPQKFHRQIINRLGILLFIDLLCLEPVVDDRILYRISYGLVDLLLVGLLDGLAEKCLNIFLYLFLE